MKKMTTPKQLALPYFIGKVALVLSTFLLLTSATMLVQAPQPRVPFPDFQNSPLPVSDFVERYDALMINDPTAVFLDAEAEYLAGIVQRVLGYTGVFKTYEFRMYGPSLIANGEIAFETAAGSFADKIENGGVVAVRGKGGQPELRKVTQNAYYLMIAMQAQGGDKVKFKVVLKLPKKAGVSDAEHGAMESAFAKIGESELLSTWNAKKIIDQAGIAEAKGVRKIADMLSNWVPGQGLPSVDAQRILEESGFLLQKLDCNSYSVNKEISGNEGIVRYFSEVTLKGAQNNLRSADQSLAELVNGQVKNKLQSLFGFDIFFVVTSDQDFGTTDWVSAEQAFADKSKKMTVWLHFSDPGTAAPQLTENSNSCSVALKVKNNLSREELEQTLNVSEKTPEEWLKWRAKPWLSDPRYSAQQLWGSNDPNHVVPLPGTSLGVATVGQLEFGFGTMCGMMDNLMEQLNAVSVWLQLTITNFKEADKVIAGSAYLTGAWLVDLIEWNLLNDFNRWIFDNLHLLDEVKSLKDNIAAFSKYLYAKAEYWFNQTTAMKVVWNALKNIDVKAYIMGFVNEIIKLLGDIFKDTRIAGYTAGEKIMEAILSWITAGSGKIAKTIFEEIGEGVTIVFKSSKTGPELAGTIRTGIDAPDNPSFTKAQREKSCAAKLGCFVTGTLVLTTSGAQPIEALNPTTPIPVYQAASTTTSYDPGTTTEFGIQALNAAHTLPGDVKDIDREEITPATWRWLHLSYTKPDGSTAQVYLRRPLWWMQQHGARAPGDKLTLLMPEMGIVGRAQLEAILPSTLDTRSWDYRAQGDYAYYPLTGFFAHESAEVWDLYFSSSKQPVGTTYNHPFYSTDRAQYVYAGELTLGERILTQSGDTVQFLLKRPHAGLSTKVYNLEVWRAHNFLVTEKGMVVHNNGCMVEVMGGKNLLCLMEDLKAKLNDKSLEAKLENALQDNDLLEKAIRENPELVKAWEVLVKYDKNLSEDKSTLEKLLDDFQQPDGSSLQTLMQSDPEVIKVWEKFKNNDIFRRDTDFLKFYSDSKLLDHLFVGDPRAVTGCHFVHAVDNITVRFADPTSVITNSLGVIMGDIEFYRPLLDVTGKITGYKWVLKNTRGDPQTFFPSAWNKDKILEEIASALSNPNKSLVPGKTRMWRAQSTSGVVVRWFEDNGVVKSVFPEF